MQQTKHLLVELTDLFGMFIVQNENPDENLLRNYTENR